MTTPFAESVGIQLNWSEQNAQIGSRAASELERLGRSGGDAASTLGDRMTRAFENVERREPTMVLRRARLAIEELAASAVGAQGPMGRMAASMAFLIPGGAMTLGAIGGLAGIGIEIKKIIDYSGELEATLTKGAEGFANMGGAASRTAFALGQTAERIDQLSQPGMLERLVGMLNFTSGPGDLGVAMGVGRESQLATAENVQTLQMEQFHREHQSVLDRAQAKANAAAKALDDAAAALGRVELGAHPSAVQLDRLNEQIELMHLGFEDIDDPTKTRIANLIRETAAIKENNDRQEERLRLFHEDQSVQARMARGIEAAAQANIPEALTKLQGFDANFYAKLLPEQQQAYVAGLQAQQPDTSPRMISTESHFDTLQRRMEAGRDRATPRPPDEQRRIDSIITASFALIRDVGQGGPAGAFGGLSGLSSAIGALKGAPPVLGPVSAVLSGFSMLTSLFHRDHKVVISDIEERALEKMKEVQGVPQTVSVVAVGGSGNARQTRYTLGRSTSLDQNIRLPYG